MKYLSLHDNELYGTIPETICTVGNSLVNLVLFQNELSGQCPRPYLSDDSRPFRRPIYSHTTSPLPCSTTPLIRHSPNRYDPHVHR